MRASLLFLTLLSCAGFTTVRSAWSASLLEDPIFGDLLEAGPMDPQAPPGIEMPVGKTNTFQSAAAAEPRLTISTRQGDLLVSWPGSVANSILEQASSIPASNWTLVSPDAYQSSASGRSVLIPRAEAGRFFRLRVLDPAIGLAAQWSFDEGAGQVTSDRRVSGQALYLTNVAWSAGRIGPGGLRFNGGPPGAGGSLAWVSNTNYRLLPPSGRPFSISLWINPDALPTGARAIAGNNANGAGGWQLSLHTPGPGTNDLIFAGVSVAPSLTVTGRTLLVPGQWRQLTLTYDGSEGSIYVDTSLLARGAGSLATHDGPIYFGGGAGAYASFPGQLDDIRLHTNCLTAEQISLRGHWRFDEGAGGTLADSGAESHDGVLTNPLARVPGRNGSGIDLSLGQVTIANADFAVLPGSGGPFSISFWLRPAALSGGRNGLMRCGDGLNNGWQLVVEPGPAGGTQLHWESRNTGGTLDLVAAVSLTNGAWTKVDLTYDGGNGAIYVNARKVSASLGAIQGSRGPIVTGGASGLSAFAGVVDELKIYARERTASEVGPIGLAMWETALLNAATELELQGLGPPGKPLSYALIPLPQATKGVPTLPAGSQRVTYQAGGQKGPDGFAYTVSDGEFTSAPALVNVSVVAPHWLSPEGGSGQQTGQAPDQAWAAGSADTLDAIWATNNYYDCFFYAPGLYQTRGWKYGVRSSANPGCKHIGSGSEGPARTTIQLVDIWGAFVEDRIFAPAYIGTPVDDFDLRHLLLDCNAENLPKYVRGEPIWIRIPLSTTGRVESVTLRWADTFVPAYGWRIGRAVEFSLCARRFGTNSYLTNCTAVTGAGAVDVVNVGVEADELFLQLERRAFGVDYYGLSEIQVQGGSVSLASATASTGGESRLGPEYSVLQVVDDDPATAWASGPEPGAEILLPLPSGTAISALTVHWNCKSLNQPGRLGPAAQYAIRARDELTGIYQDVPFVHQGRTAAGWETNTFGTPESPISIHTDRVVLALSTREAGVDYYSISEITLQNGDIPVKAKVPTSFNRLVVGNYSVMRAFDQLASSQWVCGPQGTGGAIYVTGSNLKFIDLKIIGFGTKAGAECFPFFGVHPAQPGNPVHYGNVLIEDCAIFNPATHNTDGLTSLDIVPVNHNTLTNAIVRRCQVSGVKSLFTYSHGFLAPQTEFCVVEDCQVGVYWEPDRADHDDVGPMLVRSNRFSNVTFGVYFQTHAASDHSSIACWNNEIILDARHGWGFSVCDTCDVGPSGSITNAVFLNNVVRYPGWVPQGGGGGGILYSDLQHAVFGNNVVVMDPTQALRVRACPSGIIFPPPPTEDCDHPPVIIPPVITYPPCLDVLPPGYQRAWFNNRDLSGSLLPVRWINSGADGFSSQQQWIE